MFCMLYYWRRRFVPFSLAFPRLCLWCTYWNWLLYVFILVIYCIYIYTDIFLICCPDCLLRPKFLDVFCQAEHISKVIDGQILLYHYCCKDLLYSRLWCSSSLTPSSTFHLVSASVPGQFAHYSFQGPIFLLVKKITRLWSPPSSAYYYHTKFAFCHCCSQTYPNYKSVVPMSSFQQEVIQFALVCHLANQFHLGSSFDSLLGFPLGSLLGSPR